MSYPHRVTVTINTLNFVAYLGTPELLLGRGGQITSTVHSNSLSLLWLRTTSFLDNLLRHAHLALCLPKYNWIGVARKIASKKAPERTLGAEAVGEKREDTLALAKRRLGGKSPTQVRPKKRQICCRTK